MSALCERMPALWKHSWLTFGDWIQALMTVSPSLCCGHRWVELECPVILLPILRRFAWSDRFVSSFYYIRLCGVGGASIHWHRYDSTPGCSKQPQSSRSDSPWFNSMCRRFEGCRPFSHLHKLLQYVACCTDNKHQSHKSCKQFFLYTFIIPEILCPCSASSCHDHKPS